LANMLPLLGREPHGDALDVEQLTDPLQRLARNRRAACVWMS
jgi:hypothetical protein